jgi:DNA-binding NarL/FixJ family response regulator
LAWTLSHLAIGTFELENNLTLANVYAAEAMAIQRENQDKFGLCYSLHRSNQRNFVLGNFQQARLDIEEMVHIARYINNPYNLIHSLATLAFDVLIMDEAYEQVNQLCEEAMHYYIPHSIDAQVNITFCLAMTAYVQQNPAETYKKYHHLLSLISTIPIPLYGLWVASPLAIFMLASVGNSIGATQLMARLFTPIPNTSLVFVQWIKKWGLMLRLKANLEIQLGAEQFALAWAHGQTLDLERDVAPFVTDFARMMSGENLGSILLTDKLIDTLTERELEIMRLVAVGMSNHEIADQLVLAFSTVKWYISQIYSKLGVHNRTQALVALREMGFEF